MRLRDFCARTLVVGLLVMLGLPGVRDSALAFHFPWDQGHDTFQPDPPDDEDPPEDDDPCETMSPVNLATGDKTNEYTDFLVPAIGPDLVLTRTYHSSDSADGPFGVGWRSTVTPRAITVTDGVDITVISCQGDGRRKRFVEQPDGSYTPAPGTYQTLERLSDDSLSLRDKDGTVSVFDAAGLLRSVADRHGNGLVYDYAPNGQLLSVSDDAGRALTFTSGPNGRIAQVTDPAGRVIGYEYDAEGRLVRVIGPAGGVSAYAYDAEGNLLSVTDANGEVVFALVYDAEDRVVREQLADGGVLQFSYPVPQQSTIVIDQRGGRSTYTFNENGNPTSYTDPLGNTYSLTWDDSYNRTGATDENGNTSQYAYDDAGNLVRVTNALGEVRQFTYTTDFNQIATITEADGSVSSLEYDALGNVVRVTNTTGAAFQLEYDARGQMVAVIDPDGHRTDIAYDASGNPSRVADASGELLMSYDAVGNLVSRTNADGGVATFTYDPRNLLLSETAPDGGVTTHAYDAVGNRVSTTDPLGNVTLFEYDARNRLLTTTDPTGLVTRNGYDAAGNLTSVTDPNGAVTRYEYDLAGRRTREIRPGAAVYDFTYDAVGNVLSIAGPDGVVMSYVYDALDRLLSRTSPGGDVERYTYDVRGNRTLVERLDPAANVRYRQATAYDSESRPVQIVQGAAATTSFSYDALDRMVARTDANGGVTSRVFDAFGQLLSMVDPAGGASSFVYDAVGNVLAVNDPNANATTYQYDLLGRKVLQSSPDTGVTSLAYDFNGNVVQSSDARGVTSTFGYTARDELATVQFPDAAENQAFFYDEGANGRGRLTRMEDQGGTASFVYDARGNRTQVSRSIAGVTYQTQMVYTPADRVSQVIYPSGAAVGFDFDGDGRVSAIRHGASTVISDVVYLPYGPANGWTFGSGAGRSTDFDLRYVVQGVTTTGVHDLAVTTDALGNPLAIADALDPTLAQSFGYDPMQRMVDASGAYGTLSYGYDAVGNRLQEVANGVPIAYQYAADSNRLLSTAGPAPETLVHDAAGNLVDDGRFQYEYNDAGRLSRVLDGAAEVAVYLYDAEGRRVSKTVQGQSVHFVYGPAGELLGEYDGVTGAALREYVYLGNIPVGVVQGGVLYFVHTDHLGTPRAVTDAAGTVVWRWTSAPFGDTAADTDPDGDGTALAFGLRFAGQFFDAETGRHYNYLRDYEPRWGRYIQSDPIGLRGGFNTYAYAGNNPLLFVDPTGEEIVGEWVQRPTITPSWPDAPSFSGFTLEWSWWGYLKLVKVFLKVNGRVTAKVKCTDKDECAEEERSWTLSGSFPASVSGTLSLGPNLYAIGLGLITGNVWVGIGANVALLGGATAHAIYKLERKYGDLARAAVSLIESYGPTAVCNSGWPAVNLNVTVGNL